MTILTSRGNVETFSDLIDYQNLQEAKLLSANVNSALVEL